VRIVAGAWRSRRLVAPPGRVTRPSSDRLRGSLFAALGDVTGMRVVDVFAGTGALGLEALSRGAARCVFCETNPLALAALRDNVRRLQAAPRAVVRAVDAHRQLRADAAAHDQYDLVLLDPPYNEVGRLLSTLQTLVLRVSAPGARLVVESAAGLAPELDGFRVDSRRRIGAATLSIYTRQEGP
jgi:16S rRNA (guanine966-N2)-methyltransferase